MTQAQTILSYWMWRRFGYTIGPKPALPRIVAARLDPLGNRFH